MPNHVAELDEVFQALADPTRRQVVERLAGGPVATSELARPFAMSLPSFTQHLGVLEGAGLVTSHKTGRVRTYCLAHGALDPIDAWVRDQRALWEERLDRMEALAIDDEQEQV